MLIKSCWEELKSLLLLKQLSSHMVSPKHRPNIQENTTRILGFQTQNFRTVARFLCQYRSIQIFPRLPVFSRLYVTTSEAHAVSRTRIIPHCGFIRIFSLQYEGTGLLIKIFFVGNLQFHPLIYSKVSRVTSLLPMTRLEHSVSFFQTCAPFLSYYFMC